MTRIHIPDQAMDQPLGYVATHYAPEMVAAGFGFAGAVYENTQLSLREMEAARMRTAQINGCTMCMRGRAHIDFNDGMSGDQAKFSRPMLSRGEAPDEAFYQAVADWTTSDQFSERERLAIEYAERLGERPHSMKGDEAFWSRMKANFNDAQIVDMTAAISSWMAMGRFMHALELDSVCLFESEMVGKAAAE